MNVNSIGKKISLGFIAMISTLIVSGLLSVWLSTQLAEISYNIREVAGPTVTSSLSVLNGVNQTQSSLKSWLLLRDNSYRQSRADTWRSDISPALETLNTLSRNWKNNEEVKTLDSIKSQLSELHALQDSLEEMKVESNAKAIERLGETLSPMALSIRDNLEGLIQSKNRLVDSDMALQERLISRLGYLQVILIVLGGLIGTLMSFLLIRAITVPIQKTIQLADKIASGNYGVQGEITGSEEINRLGSALERMRKGLEEKTWLNQSQILFNERIRLASTPRELADAATAAIADCLPVLAGAVYSAEGNAIQSIGGFALSQDRLLGKTFNFGQGLAGQAAAERKTLSAIGSTDGLRLETISGSVVPHEILAAPLSFKDEIVGVIELSLSAKVNPHEREFLQIASETGAIALGAVRQGEKIKNLLQETQAQAEELQLQQEELKSANEELQTRQEELRATNEELEAQKRTLDVKNTELELAQQSVAERAEELDRVSKYKSEFLANMSHELRTPLNSQLVLAKLLSDNKGGNLTEKQTEFARTIFATGQDLLKLINDILDLSKVEAGKLDLDVRDASVNEIVGDLRRDFDHVAEQKGLRFETEIGADVPTQIKTDPHRLGQILRNLISNAVKFTAKGNVTVNVFKTEGHKPGPAVAFAVSDSGIGIPESHLRSIFNAFEQVDSSIGRRYGGTGLGLAISNNLAALLDGEIKVKSQVGQGTTFTLIVPVSISTDRAEESAALRASSVSTERAAARKAPEKAAATGSSSNDEILIIEDDLKFARVLSDLAEEEGLRPLIVCDGSEGLEQAFARLPACILLDYRLPRLDGLKILKELKANPATRHIPVYMLSIDDQGLEAQKLGAMGYLLKPAEPERIRQILRRLKATAVGETRHVLVVEDNTVQREQVIETIGNGSVRAVGVASAGAALEALKGKTTFDCMVLDLSLPDMSGFELLQKVYEDGSIQVPPVVINTARTLSRDEEEKLRRYSETIIIKGVHSSERLLDEVSLFTHRIVGKMPAEMRKKVEDLYRPESVFRGKDVLLVDDEVRNIFALSSALEGTGLKVTVARNGQEALDALESLPKVDLVLMDVMMPVMDGYEAMKRIRSSEKFRRLPVIALTAKAMKEDRRLCLEAGASDYLAKPVDLDRLFSLMRVWLGG